MLKFYPASGVMQTEMANADKAIRENMQEKPADKLDDRQTHFFWFSVFPIVKIFEGDGLISDGDDAVIADGDLMCVAA